MNRTDLVESVARRSGLTSAQASEAITVTMAVILDALARGDSVSLSGFGTFERRHRPARTGRNPRTGEALDIAARDIPVFKPATAMKRAIAPTD
jgi:nucleoid DNA-binding protein